MAEKKKDELQQNESVKSGIGSASKTEKTYSSAWQKQMDGLLNKVQNRKAFSYDAAKDPLFKQAKDQAVSGGRMAMQDTMGKVATMTGGYGSSYGQSVGQQAYQENLKDVNEKIPELYELAYNRYNDEGNRLLTEYGLLADRENQDYNRYLDERNFGYQKGRDAVVDAQWRESFDYGKERDTVADDQWERSFAYGQERDATADTQWRESFDYQKEQDEYDRKLDEAGIAASLGDYSKYEELGFDISKLGTGETDDTTEQINGLSVSESMKVFDTIYSLGDDYESIDRYIMGLSISDEEKRRLASNYLPESYLDSGVDDPEEYPGKTEPVQK